MMSLEELIESRREPNETREACILRALRALHTPRFARRMVLEAKGRAALAAEAKAYATLNGRRDYRLAGSFEDYEITLWFEHRAARTLAGSDVALAAEWNDLKGLRA